MLYRHKFVTNSSSSSYLLYDVIRKLKEVHHLLRAAAYYDDEENETLRIEIEDLLRKVNDATEDFKNNRQLPIKEYLAIAREIN